LRVAWDSFHSSQVASHMITSNQSLQPTAGRSDAQFQMTSTRKFVAKLALTSGG
jgi:hypothetical protein